MKVYFSPKTLLGKWSVGLVAAFVLLIVLLVVWGYFKSAAVGIGRFQLVTDILCAAIGIPGKTYIVLFKPFAQYFGWSMATLSLIYSASLIIRAVVSIDAFVTGLIGIIKSKERSILVFLATLIGLFVLIFLLGEIIVPH